MSQRADRSHVQARVRDLEEPPGSFYADPAVMALLEQAGATVHREVPRARQIFVNRNLRMDKIEMVGFDMDYTLAMYHLRRLEDLAFRMTLERLVSKLNYPASLSELSYDAEFVIRGLVLDKLTGNIFKMDRHNHVGRCFHGRRPIAWDERKRLYRDEKIHLSMPRFAWIDTLFALPEACLFADVIEHLESRGVTVDYTKLYDDVRETIDEVHRDDSLKTVVRSDLARFVVRDRELGPALHRLRSGGKKLFLLTNSLWDYTESVMSFLLDGVLPEYPSWRNYFDVIVTAASKPGFFSEKHPILELGPDGAALGEARSLERGRIYAGGNVADLERMAGIGGDRVLYVGDHIYGDILRSKKSSLWRTCMIVPEIEAEIAWLEQRHAEVEEMARLEELRLRLDDELTARKSALNAVERRLDRADAAPQARADMEGQRRELKRELELLRRAHRDLDFRLQQLQHGVEEGFNRYWGLTFKEGNENSRFGEQIEDYACVYTSRVSNLAFYSPMQYFRSHRAAMPHERYSLRLAPYGDEHGAPPAGDRPSKQTGTNGAPRPRP